MGTVKQIGMTVAYVAVGLVLRKYFSFFEGEEGINQIVQLTIGFFFGYLVARIVESDKRK